MYDGTVVGACPAPSGTWAILYGSSGVRAVAVSFYAVVAGGHDFLGRLVPFAVDETDFFGAVKPAYELTGFRRIVYDCETVDEAIETFNDIAAAVAGS